MEHLTQVTTRDASCIVDDKVIPDHPEKKTDETSAADTSPLDENKEKPAKPVKGAAHVV